MTQLLPNGAKLRFWLKWLFSVTCFVALCAAFWPSEDHGQTVDSHPTATTAGSNSPAIAVDAHGARGPIFVQTAPNTTMNSPGSFQGNAPNSPNAGASASVVVSGSPAIVAPIQFSHDVTQNLTVNQSPPKRLVTPEQAVKMKSILAPLAGSNIRIVTNMNDSESGGFADGMAKVFQDAGWGAHVSWAMSINNPPLLLRISKQDVSEDLSTRTSKLEAAGEVGIRISDVSKQIFVTMEALNVLGMKLDFAILDQLKTGEIELRVGGRE